MLCLNIPSLQAFEFYTTAHDGVIHIPRQYRDKIRSNIKVIVLSGEPVKAANKEFNAIRLRTKGFKFDREEVGVLLQNQSGYNFKIYRV